jgi:hypothetical protein
LFKSWSPGSGGATVGKTIFTCVYIEKIYFSKTSRPISVKLGTYHPWVKGIPNYSNQGPGPLQMGDDHKNGVGSFKNLLKNHRARRVHTYMNA